jgi:cation transport regulator
MSASFATMLDRAALKQRDRRGPHVRAASTGTCAASRRQPHGGGAMPYSRTSELPAPVRDHLPQHAQEIYKEAFNSAWDEYDTPQQRRGDASREETAHKVAWTAVKQKYEKGDDGDWHRK